MTASTQTTNPVEDEEVDVSELTDEELAAIIAEAEDGDDENENEIDDSVDPVEPAPAPAPAVTQEASLSNTQQRALDLANATAQAAQQRADEALRRAANAEWRETRSTLLLAGVPPVDLDLAEPVLNRPFPMVLDLSNEIGGGAADLDVSKIVRALLDNRKGTVDLAIENGHGGLAPGEKDPDEDILKAWDEQYSR